MLDSSQALLVFLAIVAVAFLLQAVAFLIVAMRVNRVTRSVEGHLGKLLAGSDRTLDLLTEFLRQVRPILQTVEKTVGSLNDLTLHLRSLAQETGDTANDLAQRARDKIVEIEQEMDRGLERYREASESVHLAILRPTTEVSAVAKGVRTAMRHLFRRGPRVVQ
ncbi:MAG: hypothetical protein ACR2L2_15870 [Acidobacteriota bacterium]